MNNKIDIQKANIEHINDIVAIENLCFKIPWSRQSIAEEITGNNMAYYIFAKMDGNAAGYAGMWQILDEGHITNIAVHPEYRQNGVGSALLKSLIIHARNSGIGSMTLEVKKSNISAQRLYRKFYFRESGLRKAYYADNNEDALIMWLEGIQKNAGF